VTQLERNKGIKLGILISLELALLFLIAILLRWPGLGEEVLHDELYSFLAARGLLEHGDMLIVNSAEPYNRAAIFTRVVAACMGIFGQTLFVARIPALVAGSILAGVIFLWLRLNGERVSGWVAGILIALDPLLIQLSQVVRFYSFQHLFFIIGSIGVYLFLFYHCPVIVKLIALSITVIAFLISFNLQMISVFGFGGILLFAGVAIYFIKIKNLKRKAQLAIMVSTGIVAGIAIVYAIKTDLIVNAIELMTYADLWAAESVDNYRFYYSILHSNYQLFWPLFPLFLVFAVIRQPRLTAMCATVFVVGFIGLSLAAWKAERYFAFLLPFFFVVVAIGLVSGTQFLFQYIRSKLFNITLPFISEKFYLTLSLVVTAAIFGFAISSNYGYLTTARLLTREHVSSFPLMGQRDGKLSWSRAATKLRKIADEVDVIVSSDDLKAIYHLGRADYILSPNSLRTREGILPEFSPDHRTGARIVASNEAISAIMKCHKSGLFIVQAMSLGQSATSSPRLLATNLVSEKAELIEMPKEWGLIAYRWKTPQNELDHDCPPKMMEH
jgi:hypothetical protein